MTTVTENVLEKLRQSSSVTCSTILSKAGLQNVAIRGARRVSRDSGVMVGEALTLRNIPSREDVDRSDILQSHDHPQRKAFETCPPRRVLVVDCRGETYGAFGGAILICLLGGARLRRYGVGRCDA